LTPARGTCINKIMSRARTTRHIISLRSALLAAAQIGITGPIISPIRGAMPAA